MQPRSLSSLTSSVQDPRTAKHFPLRHACYTSHGTWGRGPAERSRAADEVTGVFPGHARWLGRAATWSQHRSPSARRTQRSTPHRRQPRRFSPADTSTRASSHARVSDCFARGRAVCMRVRCMLRESAVSLPPPAQCSARCWCALCSLCPIGSSAEQLVGARTCRCGRTHAQTPEVRRQRG